MHGLIVDRSTRVLETRPFEEPAKVFERNPAVDLDECPLDYVFQLEGVDGSRATEGQEVAPGFRGKPAPFVGSHDPKRHRQRQSIIHSRNLFAVKGSGKNAGKCLIETLHTGEPVL